ncbi:hypothetical protein C8J57DRAFT_197511 [Mycena rebaudengoi]|nr:hypothetical protein C8J57DRAFT_197511 [Mycena rebaudengoi]
MHFNQPRAGLELQPCTVVTFSPGGPQPLCSALAVAAEWRTERRRWADAQEPRWHVVKGGAWLEVLSLADLVHEWRLGCRAHIPFHHRSVCGMDVTDDELITSMLTYPRELGHRAGVPSNVPSSPSCPTPTYRPATIPVSSFAARNSSKKRSAVEMAADSSSDDDEARSSKRLKSSVPTTTRTTCIPSAYSIATRSKDRNSAKAKKPPSCQGGPERPVRSSPTTTVPAVEVAEIRPPPAMPVEAPVTSPPSPCASWSKKRSVAEMDSEPLVDGL